MEAIEKAIQRFEDRQRGLPQAEMAAKLVAEIRAGLASAVPSIAPIAEQWDALIAAENHLRHDGQHTLADVVRRAPTLLRHPQHQPPEKRRG